MITGFWGNYGRCFLRTVSFYRLHTFSFLTRATVSFLNGTFYSGNYFKEPFAVKRNEFFELSSPDSLTFLNDGYKTLRFSFPDTKVNLVSLIQERLKHYVVVVQIMGTWCPNCLDEIKFLVEYMNDNENKNIVVDGLAFEYSKKPSTCI